MRIKHHGSTEWRYDKWIPIKNDPNHIGHWNKPVGGLWTSPSDSIDSWKQYCDRERYQPEKLHESFELILKGTAKILVIDDYIDLNIAHCRYGSIKTWATKETRKRRARDITNYEQTMLKVDMDIIEPYIDLLENGKPMALDFENIARHYDAIHLTPKGQEDTRWSTPHNLYGWDCETILILNTDNIKAA